MITLHRSLFVVFSVMFASDVASGLRDLLSVSRASAVARVASHSDISVDFRITETGASGDINFNALNPSIAYHKGLDRYLVVWEVNIGGESEIWGQLLDGEGAAIGAAFPVSNTPGDANFDAFGPDVAAGGDAFLVAWYADRDEGSLVNDEFEIYAQLVSTDGVPQFAQDKRISVMGADGTSAFSATAPAVAYNRTAKEYLVVWAGIADAVTGSEIFVQRIDKTGAEVGTNDFRITDLGLDNGSPSYNAFVPDVAWNSDDNQYLVVWHGDDQTDNEFEIYGQRLAGLNAAVIGSNDFRISSQGPDANIAYNAFNPAVSYNPASDRYLVVWNGDNNVDGVIDNENEIYGQLLTDLGVDSGSDFRISDMGPNGNGNYDAFFPAIQADSALNQFLVTWQGDDSTAPLVDNEIEIFGQVLSGFGVESAINDFRISNAGTSGNTIFGAMDVALAYNLTKREFMIVWEADAEVNSEFEVYAHRHAELDDIPTAQPTAPLVSSRTATSFSVSFSSASGSPDGYVVLRNAEASPVAIPADHHVYQVGDIIGNDTVVFVGNALTFNQTGLSPFTTYNYDFFSYNGVNSSTHYLTTSPLGLSVTTLAAEPLTQTTSIVVKSVTQSSVTFNFTKGSGSSRLVVLKKDAVVNVFPSDASSYSVNGDYTLAPDMGSGNRAVALRTGSDISDITITNLPSASSYQVRVFEFNGTGTLTNYKTGSDTGNPLFVFTLSAEPLNQPTDLLFQNITPNSISGTFTAATGAPDGYLVIRRAGAAPTGKPVDGKIYAPGDTVGAGGNALVVHKGSAVSFNSTGLSPETVYYFAVFSYNGNDGSVNYRLASPLVNNAVTLAAAPSGPASQMTFANVTSSSMDVVFQPPSANPTGYLVLQKPVSAPLGKPIDGKTYAAGDTVGSDGAIVIHSGSNTTVPGSGLEERTVYHYTVFPYNGSGSSRNYLTSTPLTNSRTTYAAEPTSQPENLVLDDFTMSSMSGSIIPSESGAEGYLVLARSGSSPTEIPGDGQTFTAGSTFGASKVVHVGSATSFSNNGLDAGTVYEYDVFAFNGSDETINYLTVAPTSNSAITVPPTPVALDAGSVLANSFTARWTASVGAEYYELDVFLADPPGSFVTNYQARRVDSGLEEPVIGLASNTPYKYHVRAVNASGKSPNSLDKSVTTTSPAATFQIDPPLFSATFTAGAKISVEVRGASGPADVTMHARKISAPDFTQYPATLKSGSQTTYEVTVLDEMGDELGMEFYFEADDGVQVIGNPSYYHSYRSVSASSNLSIPFAGGMNGKTSTYQMFSIPYELDDDDIADLFETALNGYDPSRWRMFHHEAGGYREYPNHFRKLTTGVGYWFNTIEKDFQIPITAAEVVHASQSNPYELTLQAGWNQIGNPYPFNISWEAVAGTNDKLGALWFFKNGDYTKSDVFEPWTGAFIHADEAMTLPIPVTARTNASGRLKENFLPPDLDADQWLLPIALAIGELRQTSGVGMHAKASDSKDAFDEITVPRFLDYIEFNTNHREFFSPYFSTDVVPVRDDHAWVFDVNSNMEGQRGELTWDHHSIATNRSSLILIDLLEGRWVDMKTTGNYLFTHKKGRQFRIVYSRDGDISPGVTLLGDAYPNPFTSELTIPILIDEPGYRNIGIYDSFGRRIRTITKEFTATGLHEVRWNIKDGSAEDPGSGLLYYRLEGSGVGMRRVIRR